MSTGFRDGLRVLAPSHSLASLFIAAIAWTTFLFSVAAWAVNIHHFIHKDSLTQLLYEVAAESLYQQHGRLAFESLERRRSVLSSTLLSSQNTLARIQRASANSDSASSPAATALTVAEKQQKHNLENLHRTCAGVTAFRVKDPDPYAVDNGKILGVRIEVSVKGRFAAPYYLLLNRPSPESENLRIHKHTIPPCKAVHRTCTGWYAS
ncbi:cenp-o kinetochore centromere component [Neofusicoccum parvum]|uniref:Cenp-o kinetochore centromere component n=2 Tax=Neofusicoccum parvum TaxID=310453 RepID=A0ACB5S561_9PEZI|nr:putative cenp-o kinetochore centromere component protein [Neofusicoccum parvum UCRNP2]GME27945.1 cenp-o kinetochore centromere component [Neofusicoccum parvum]GME65439.1 cenp-o kinetochore centromere component [Neofusicoccum parvum]